MARRELFPPNRGLQVRMAVALLVNGLLLAVAVAAVTWLLVAVETGWALVFFLACFVVIGALAPAARSRHRRKLRAVRPEDLERVDGCMRGVCLAADFPAPEVWVERDAVPLSWTVAPLRGKAKVSVTTGLLDRLPQPELEAVLAHELSHLANRDAAVMTLLAGPPVWMLRGVRKMWDERRDDWRNALAVLLYGVYALPVGFILVASSRLVSRQRELAADRGAAILTGSPSALASALRRLSGELAAMPQTDLRVVAARDPFHFLPARRSEAAGVRRLWATHPRLERRLLQLEEMEGSLKR